MFIMLSDNLVGDTHLHTCLVLSAVPPSTKFSVVDLVSDDGSFFAALVSYICIVHPPLQLMNVLLSYRPPLNQRFVRGNLVQVIL